MTYAVYEKWKRQPLSETPEISVVIPAYNEEIRIIPTIGAIASHMVTLGRPWELIVADDGSADQTVAMIEALEFANLRVLVAPQNGGKGSAVKRGMLAARGAFILFTDADNSTPIEEVGRLLHLLEVEGYDIAVGSRAAEGAEVENKSLKRRILSAGLNAIVQNLFRIRVKDTQCGFKLFTRDAAQRLHNAQTLMGFSFDLEILYLAFKFGYKVAEVPVSWFDAPGSKVDTAKEARRFITDLVKIKVTDLKGGYAHA
jgi:dolichyl-phosphate beta-glucosyltransferase